MGAGFFLFSNFHHVSLLGNWNQKRENIIKIIKKMTSNSSSSTNVVFFLETQNNLCLSLFNTFRQDVFEKCFGS